MPVTAPVVTASITTAGAGGLNGPVWLNLAAAVGLSVEQWVAAGGVVLAGVTTGTAGVGTVVGTSLFFPPQPLPMTAAATAVGILGGTGQLAAAAIGVGVANAFNATAGYAGVSIGVGAGTDLSKVTYADPTLLTSLLTANLAAVGIAGQTGMRFAGGLASGLSTLAMTGASLVPGIVTGVPSPLPAVGNSSSKVV
jgi:hypothetical protein